MYHSKVVLSFRYPLYFPIGDASYIALFQMWAMSCHTFVDLPYSFLVSCVKHPHLTVDSEWHLCEALLAWVSSKMEIGEHRSSTEDGCCDNSKQINITKDDWTSILEEIRVCLLPLWFTLGKSKCCYFSGIAKQGIAATFSLLKRASNDSNSMVNANDWSHMKIRLTEYSKKLDLSGCTQVTSGILLLSLLPELYSGDPLLLEGILQTSIDHERPKGLPRLPTLSFEAMLEVDVSKCSRLHLGGAIECFHKSFPFLRIIKMTHLLDFETKKLCQLIEKCSSVSELDLTVDVSPLLSSKASVLSSGSLTKRVPKSYFDVSSCQITQQSLSNITKLTLEGRTDFADPELHKIAELCVSLCYLNIQGCLLVTDVGISNLILRCRRLHSIIATDTSFGRNSISALCSIMLDTRQSCMVEMDQNHLKASGTNLQILHIGSCKGVSETSLVEILSHGCMLKSLCLRDTCLGDQALYNFSGSSLEMLDVSNTMISGAALLHTITKNPGLKYLKAKGCRNLLQHQSKNKEGYSLSHYHHEVFSMLGKKCKLEELSIGWGFSFPSLDAVRPALWSLKAINVGLGVSLGPEVLITLCSLCPSLESVTLLFQVISDTVIMKLMGTLENLRVLSVCYCIGDISPLSLRHNVPNLRKLKLERVAPWMTNHDLFLLTKNCANLTELSLVGCTHLDVDSQQIISSGWPGLISLHLEDCGALTANGVGFLFDCKAMEELLLRHNGPGIQRSFILDAASKLPMIRSISLDWCDANEGEFDLPRFTDRYSLSNVKISRCKLQKYTLGFHNTETQKRPVHKETLVLMWNSTSLQRVVVEERIT